MIVKVLGLVFLFIIRIRFPKCKSIRDIIRSRKICKFEKNDYKLGKGHLDLRFLQGCQKKNLNPKILQFKFANRHLHNSAVYKKCQIKLLEEEIKAKQKRIDILEKDTKRIREELRGTLSCLDFSYICSLFLVANDKSILHHDNTQKLKLKNLLEISLIEVTNDSHDPNKVIFNFSSYELSDVEKRVLCKGLNFSVKPKLIEYSEFLLPFELLFQDVKQENLCSEDLCNSPANRSFCLILFLKPLSFDFLSKNS